MRLDFRLCLIALLVACNVASDEETTGPSGADVTAPYPLQRADLSANTPATYKGLPLQLVNHGTPTVTAVDGKIGVVCVGMSNGNQECADFIERFAAGYALAAAPGITIVNCAVGGHAIERWNDPAYDADLWQRCINTRVPAAGLRLDQVRVIWHKAANQFTTGPNGAALPLYPAAGSDYEAFVANLTRFSTRVKAFFPNVQAVYTTSRSYGGFGSANRGEPLSYEEGHALNTWLRSNPNVGGVWYGWGPYIWAPDCATRMTNDFGVCYERADYVADGVHPSATGRAKVSAQLHTFFLTQSWYRRL